jgi:hypothetical protein
VLAVAVAAACAAGCSGKQTDQVPPSSAPGAPAAQPGVPAAEPGAPTQTAAEEPLPEVGSPYDALPEGVRSLLDRPLTGDLDAMAKRRLIRAGVTFNRTHYFTDKGQQRGIAYESLTTFEE